MAGEITTFIGKITTNFLLIADANGSYKNAVRLFETKDGKSFSNLKLYVNSNENSVKDIYFFDTLLNSPDLKGSYVVITCLDGKEIKILTDKNAFKKDSSRTPDTSNIENSAYMDLVIDNSNNSKFIRKVTDTEGSTWFLIPSGIRRASYMLDGEKSTEKFKVDLENNEGELLVNVPVSNRLYSKIKSINKTKKVEEVEDQSGEATAPVNGLSATFIPSNTAIVKSTDGTIVLYKNLDTVTVDLSSENEMDSLLEAVKETEKQEKVMEDTEHISVNTKTNITLKSAWAEATKITGLVKTNPFDDFLKQYINYTGNNKSKSALDSFDFMSEEEARDLIKKKNPALYKTLQDGRSMVAVTDSGVKIGSGDKSIRVSDTGIEMSMVRVKDGKNQLTTGPVPIPTVANDANDLKPDGSAFIATPRRYPLMNEIVTTFKVLTVMTNIALQSVKMIKDCTELKAKFDEYKKEGK